MDEQSILRRKTNIQNFGSSWLKPPGVFKSLHQQREEKRELEEQKEAMRREELQAELEAEAARQLMQETGAEDDMEADLDDEIPDADDMEDDNNEDDDEEGDDDDEDSEDSDTDEEELQSMNQARRLPNQRPQGTPWLHGDAYREGLARGDMDGGSFLGEEENIDASQLLQEDDLHLSPQERHAYEASHVDDVDMGVDMDAVDLDASAVELSLAGYEHTDTEDEEESSMLEGVSAISVTAMHPPVQTYIPAGYRRQPEHISRNSFVSDGREQSLDLSGIDLRSSSLIEEGSSPAMMTRSGFLDSSGTRAAGRR